MSRLALALPLLPLLPFLAACAADPPPPPPPPLSIPLVQVAAPAAAPPAPKPPPPEPARPPETFDLPAIDAWVGSQVQQQGLVGLSLAIVRDGKVVLAKGYGQASREKGTPVDASTAFAVGSVTKQFTCASLLLLAQGGKLSMKDKLSRYYPDLPHAKDITLADLGSHVSGYPDYYPLDFFDSRMQHGIAPDDLIKKYAAEPLDFAPGTRWSYSNTGFIVLGRVIEKVSGEPFGKFLSERILAPVGMQHAAFAPPEGTAGLAQGYESFALSEPRPAPREPESWLFSAGALYASASDLAAWDLALVDGKVLKPAGLKLMTTPRTLADGRSAGYGCGLSVSQQRGDTVLSHNGEVNGFLAANAIVPRTRLAVVLLTNSQFGDPEGIHRALVALVVKDGAPSAKPPVVDGAPAKEVALSMLHELQRGAIDRTRLGAEFSLYMTEALVKDAAARLGPLGEPSNVEVTRTAERGGMEVSDLHFTFTGTKLDAWMYRTPDGKVQEFLLHKQ